MARIEPKPKHPPSCFRSSYHKKNQVKDIKKEAKQSKQSNTLWSAMLCLDLPYLPVYTSNVATTAKKSIEV